MLQPSVRATPAKSCAPPHCFCLTWVRTFTYAVVAFPPVWPPKQLSAAIPPAFALALDITTVHCLEGATQVNSPRHWGAVRSILEKLEYLDARLLKIFLVSRVHRQVVPWRNRSDVTVFNRHQLPDLFELMLLLRPNVRNGEIEPEDASEHGLGEMDELFCRVWRCFPCLLRTQQTS
jgi:hypothetical protein